MSAKIEEHPTKECGRCCGEKKLYQFACACVGYTHAHTYTHSAAKGCWTSNTRIYGAFTTILDKLVKIQGRINEHH
jgi:hypothetical protein